MLKRLLVLILTMSFSLTAHALDRSDEINKLYALFNQRFDAQGKYHADASKAAVFTKAQDELVNKFKAEGALKEILLIENNFDSALWVRLFVLQNEQGQIMNFFWEQGKYQDDEVRSYLRFRTLGELAQGLHFVPVFDSYAFSIQGFYMTPQTGGTLQISYAENMRAKKIAYRNIFLLKQSDHWSLQTEQRQLVSKASLNIWVLYLPPNGGVQEMRLY